MVFDDKLNFHAHVDFLKTKAEVLITRVLNFVRMHYTLRPVLLRRLYRQALLPAVAYASPVWWPAFLTSHLIARVQSVQRSLLMALTGAFHTTPTLALQILANCPPLPLELDHLNAEFSFVLRQATHFAN